MSEDPVRVTRIEFQNIGGIDSLVLEPKPFTVIYGTNGAGKSTIIKAFRRFFEGGYDPTIVRKGADKGIVNLTFSDGNYGVRTINAKTRKSTLELFSATGEAIRPPQETIEEYASGFAFDPLALLSAPKAKRLEYLEQFLNVSVAAEELMGACQDSDFLRLYNPRESAFTNIDRIHQSAYEQRSKINSEASNLKGAVETIRSGVPSLNEDGADWAKTEQDARAEMMAANSEYSAALGQVAEEVKAAKDRAALLFGEKEKAIEAEYLAALRAAEQAKERQMAEARGERSKALAIIAESETAARSEIQANQGAAAEAARAKHAAAQKALSDYNEANGARAQILKLEAQIAEKAGRALALTNILTRLKELRAEKQASNPIPGLEIRTIEVRDKTEAEIFYEGIEFDALNTGKRMELCIQLATLGLGRCPLLIVDDTINIEEANWQAFVTAARGSGLQIVAARLDSGELRIETCEELAA